MLTAVLLVEALTPALARPGGRIVLISSASALQGNATPAYGAAKAALHGWVLSLADRLGRDGITANVVAPGFTDGTELVAGRIPPEAPGPPARPHRRRPPRGTGRDRRRRAHGGRPGIELSQRPGDLRRRGRRAT